VKKAISRIRACFTKQPGAPTTTTTTTTMTTTTMTASAAASGGGGKDDERDYNDGDRLYVAEPEAFAETMVQVAWGLASPKEAKRFQSPMPDHPRGVVACGVAELLRQVGEIA
jgi:hypothetical protein